MVTIQRQCRTWHVARAKLGVLWTSPKTLYLNNRTTAGPIGLRLGIQLGTQQTIHVCGSFLGASARAHVHTPLLYLENGWTDWADIWHVASGYLVMWLPHVYRGVTMHVRTCTLTSISRERLNRLRLNLACSLRPVSYVASAYQWEVNCNHCTCARAHPWHHLYVYRYI